MATIKIGKKVAYQVEKDNQGGMWIEGTPRIAKISVDDQILDLHERYVHISFNTILSLPECPKPSPEWKKPRCLRSRKNPQATLAKTKHPIRTNKPLTAWWQKNSYPTKQKLIQKLIQGYEFFCHQAVHADLIGPIKPVTPGNQYQYLLVVVDDFSRYVLVKPLNKKGEAGDTLIEIINLLENHTNIRTNQVQADWGGESRNTELAIELKQRGTSLKETVPYHSETNAIAERMNRTHEPNGHCSLEWDKVSKNLAYTKNRIPHKSLGGKTPVEILFIKNARMEWQNLRPFGQKVICYDYETTDKLSPRSYEDQIVGYTETHGTYWLKDKTSKTRLAKSPKTIKPLMSQARMKKCPKCLKIQMNKQKSQHPRQLALVHTAFYRAANILFPSFR